MNKKDLKRLTVVLILSVLLGAMEEPRGKAHAAVGPLVASTAVSCILFCQWPVAEAPTKVGDK